ncbi:tyrosine-type recombinase/integrase [Bifidobacterium sp. W8107]
MSDTLVRFLAYVGLRIGKTAALKVSNMDFEKLRVNILRIWTEDDKSKPALGSAKTWEHKRVAIPLFLVVPPPLKRLCSGQPPKVFVFRPKRGEHINIKNWYNRIWVKAVAGSGLTIHSLHHTFASLSIATGGGGGDVKMVQNALGHADASIP